MDNKRTKRIIDYKKKQWPQEDLLDLVNLGEQEYKDALKLWGRDTTLLDSLKQDIADTNIIVQELPETDKRLGPGEGGRYARGPYSKSPDVPFHPEGKANPEAIKDTIFIRAALGSKKYPSLSREEVLAHEFGHYFEPHYPGEKILSWIKNPIDAFKYFARSPYQSPKKLLESGEFDDILRTPTSMATFNEMFSSVGKKYQLSKAKEKAEAMKEAGYKLPKGLQEGGLIGYLESAVSDRPHSQMDRLLLEDEMGHKYQYTMGTPDYGTNIFGQQLTEPYNISESRAQGDFLPPAGMAKMIQKSAKPLWKYATGESMLEGMEKSIKENIPEYFGKPRKWITGIRGSAVPKPEKIKNPLAKKELEKIAKKLYNVELDLPKSKLKTKKTSADFVKEARQVLDINIAEGLSQMRKYGIMSPLQENKISGSVKNLQRTAKKWLKKDPRRDFENIKKQAMDYFNPYQGVDSYRNVGSWSDVRPELDRIYDVQKKVLGPSRMRDYNIWNILQGRTRPWGDIPGTARFNLKLKPDVLNPKVVPVNKRKPK